jgi:hypothetical protein
MALSLIVAVTAPKVLGRGSRLDVRTTFILVRLVPKFQAPIGQSLLKLKQRFMVVDLLRLNPKRS